MTPMTPETHFDTMPRTVSDQAAYWFALLLDGSETENDRKAFARWVAEDPSHLHAFDEIERLWNGSSSLQIGANRNLGRRAFLGGTIVAMVLGAGWTAHRFHPLADIRTASGERREMVLPGGVKAMLASDTSLSLVAKQGVSGVAIHQGEAWFDHQVAGTNFFVAATGGTTWSEGGRFDVANYAGTTTVIAEQNGLVLRAGGTMKPVQAGQEVRYGDGWVSDPRKVNVGNALAWRNGQLVFIGERLDDVVNILERWQDGKIVILGDALKSRKVTIVVDLDRSRHVLDALSTVLSIKVDQFTDYLTVVRAA